MPLGYTREQVDIIYNKNLHILKKYNLTMFDYDTIAKMCIDLETMKIMEVKIKYKLKNI